MTSQTVFLLGAKVNNTVAEIESNIFMPPERQKKKKDLQSHLFNNMTKCHF